MFTKELDCVATHLQNCCKSLPEGSDPLCSPEAARGKRRLLRRAMPRAEILQCSHLRGASTASQGVFLPHSLIPPDGLSSDSAVREPSPHRADGAADTCKNKTINSLTFPSCQVCYKKNQDSCFMGCTILEGYKKNRIHPGVFDPW